MLGTAGKRVVLLLTIGGWNLVSVSWRTTHAHFDFQILYMLILLPRILDKNSSYLLGQGKQAFSEVITVNRL